MSKQIVHDELFVGSVIVKGSFSWSYAHFILKFRGKSDQTRKKIKFIANLIYLHQWSVRIFFQNSLVYVNVLNRENITDHISEHFSHRLWKQKHLVLNCKKKFPLLVLHLIINNIQFKRQDYKQNCINTKLKQVIWH